MERKVLLAFRGIVDSLFKGKDVFVMGGYLLEKEHLMFLERVHRVYPHLTRDDTLIMLLVRMRFRNTEIARMLHVKPGFTAYRSRSNDGSSIVMLTGIPVPSVEISRYSSSFA